MSWRGPNQYDEQDEWERFVMAHAALLEAGPVFFASGRENKFWRCKKCQEPMVVAVFASHELDEYYYWCRCGTFGKDSAEGYNEK